MIKLNEIIRELETPPVEITESNLLTEDIEKLASFMESTNDQFEEGVRILADDFKLLDEKRDLARDIVSELVKRGSLENSQIFSKLDELEETKLEDLKILSKALQLSKTGNFKLGSLSDEKDLNTEFKGSASEALEHIVNKVRGD